MLPHLHPFLWLMPVDYDSHKFFFAEFDVLRLHLCIYRHLDSTTLVCVLILEGYNATDAGCGSAVITAFGCTDASVFGFWGREIGGGGNDDAVGMGFILGPIAGPIVEIEMLVLGSARCSCRSGIKASVRMLLWYNVPWKGSHTGSRIKHRECAHRHENIMCCKLDQSLARLMRPQSCG